MLFVNLSSADAENRKKCSMITKVITVRPSLTDAPKSFMKTESAENATAYLPEPDKERVVLSIAIRRESGKVPTVPILMRIFSTWHARL